MSIEKDYNGLARKIDRKSPALAQAARNQEWMR
jgi:hypothetical protein